MIFIITDFLRNIQRFPKNKPHRAACFLVSQHVTILRRLYITLNASRSAINRAGRDPRKNT